MPFPRGSPDGSAAVFLLASGSVFFFALLSFDVLVKAFRQYELRYVARSVHDLGAMFLFIEPGQVVRLNLAVMLLLAACGGWLGGPLCAAHVNR